MRTPTFLSLALPVWLLVSVAHGQDLDPDRGDDDRSAIYPDMDAFEAAMGDLLVDVPPDSLAFQCALIAADCYASYAAAAAWCAVLHAPETYGCMIVNTVACRNFEINVFRSCAMANGRCLPPLVPEQSVRPGYPLSPPAC